MVNPTFPWVNHGKSQFSMSEMPFLFFHLDIVRISTGGERIPLDPKSGGLLNAAAAAAEVAGQLR